MTGSIKLSDHPADMRLTGQQTTQVSSAEIRAAFGHWLAIQIEAGVRLVILEGLPLSGKSWLIQEPFKLNGHSTENIELDRFLKKPVPQTTRYIDAIDRAALEAVIDAAFVASTVIVEGPIAWPFAQAAVTKIGPEYVRRVYLKRMMKEKPNIWVDEGFEQRRHPSEYIQSVNRYHAEQKPWLYANLILERVEEGADAHRD